VPASWQRVGSWRLTNNYICGDAELSFYAVDPTATLALETRLREYSPKVSASVIVDISAKE